MFIDQLNFFWYNFVNIIIRLQKIIKLVIGVCFEV